MNTKSNIRLGLRSALIACLATTALTHLQAATPLEIAQQAYLKPSNTQSFLQFGAAVAVWGDTVVVGAPLENSSATGINGNQTSNDSVDSGAVYIFVRHGTNWTQQAYLKASNTGSLDSFGFSVAIWENTVVVGARGESSNATGVNGNGQNNSAEASGAAYVFVRNGTNWTQQAYLKASNTGAGDQFGYSVAVSSDTIVVGAWAEDSGVTGVNGDQSNNSAPDSGAAYVFSRSGTNWSQQAYLKASNAGMQDYFGVPVAVWGDTVAVGASGEDSNALGINGNQASNSALDAGAAYIFVRTGTNWSQQAYLKASNTGANDWFGEAVAVSGDTVVVSAFWEDSNATGVNGNQSNNSSLDSGAAYVFVRTGTNWIQQAYLKASNTGAGDYFGGHLALLDNTIVVAAFLEASNATGVNGNQSDDSAWAAGAAYVFARSGTNWTQKAYLKASNAEVVDNFGGSEGGFSGVALSGEMVIVGAPGEDSNATGVNGNQSNNSLADAGAAYVFTITPSPLPELRLSATRSGDMLQLTATGTTNTNWRLESRDTVTGTNAWQPLTNFTLGPSPTVIQHLLDGTNRFYRGVWAP